MRVRTAKKLAERIDLNYFKRAHGMRRWRNILSTGIPALAVLWIAGLAAAGSRKAYSPGPVSSAHAFTEIKCEVCHTSANSSVRFRAHVSEKACLTCHDAPAHAANQTAPPDCGSCHVEHSGRVQLAKVDDGWCLECHGDLKTTHGPPSIGRKVGRFPSAHPQFAVARNDAKDPGTIKFNHAVHIKKDGVRSLKGVEILQCIDCHPPSPRRGFGAAGEPPLHGFGAAGGPRTSGDAARIPRPGAMSAANYAQHCARCHGLEFDYRIEAPAPHDQPAVVRAAVRTALADYIAAHPGETGKPDDPRRLPLNFPRVAEPPARSAAEWVARRADNAERVLWARCRTCHTEVGRGPGSDPGSATTAALPAFAASDIRSRWMTRAAFDHTPHLIVQCVDCHAAEASQSTSDVLMPGQAACATCHAPSRGAEARCFECHPYHDWSKSHAVTPAFRLTDFK